MESAKLRKIVLLAGAVAATAASAGSLPSDGLQVHFRADDQAALNNGAGAAQWSDVTNWQGGGAAAPLLKQVEKPDGGLRKVWRDYRSQRQQSALQFVNRSVGDQIRTARRNHHGIHDLRNPWMRGDAAGDGFDSRRVAQHARLEGSDVVYA